MAKRESAHWLGIGCGKHETEVNVVENKLGQRTAYISISNAQGDNRLAFGISVSDACRLRDALAWALADGKE